ncbi:MAG: YadA-like family protein, partial [Hyphomicrobium sp.]
NSTANGRRSSASGVNSVALGAGAIADLDDTVSVGHGGAGSIGPATRRIVNVTAGVADTDAVNMAQLNIEAAARASADNAIIAVNTLQTARLDANDIMNTTQNTRLNAIDVLNLTQDGRLTMHDTRLNAIEALNLTQSSQIAALQSLTATHTSQIATLFSVTNFDRRDARRGTAAAIAEVPAPFPSEPGKTSYTFNLANFRGQQAMGLSLAHRFGSDTPFALTAGASYAGGRSTAVRVGVAGEF